MKYTRKYKIKRKSKKRSTRNQRGGGKSLEQIISELKEKGKYEDWVSKGSYFAYRPIQVKFPFRKLTFRYTFIDMDGKEIPGQMQGKEYKSDLENIPVFGEVFKKHPGLVNKDGNMILYHN